MTSHPTSSQCVAVHMWVLLSTTPWIFMACNGDTFTSFVVRKNSRLYNQTGLEGGGEVVRILCAPPLDYESQRSYYIMFFTRLTSWQSASKIIARRRNISPLYPLPPSLALSVFLPSLRNKFKTKVFPVQLKTSLEVVLSELKIWDFNHYVQERMAILHKNSHSLKLQYLFRAHVIFQFTHQQRRAVRFGLSNVVKT